MPQSSKKNIDGAAKALIKKHQRRCSMIAFEASIQLLLIDYTLEEVKEALRFNLNFLEEVV